MKLNSAKEVIQEHFATELIGTSYYTFENEEYKPPESYVAWIRLAVRSVAGGQDTLGVVGKRKYLRSGLIVAQIFAPTDEGTFNADTLATEILDMFESTRLDDDLWCNNGTIRELPADGGMYRNIVEIEFEYEETK